MIKNNSSLNVEVTYYLNLKQVIGIKKNLLDILYDMSEETGVSTEITELRISNDKSLLQLKKKTLPCFIPSGVFARRNMSGLLCHSRLIQLDIDLKDNLHITNFKDLKHELKKISNIAFIGLSVSGEGLWGLIPIKYPDKHKEHFRFIENAFASWGIVIDPSGSDITRLRIVSYDPDPYYNHDALPLEQYFIEQPFTFKEVDIESGDEESKIVEAIERLIFKNRIDITKGYQNWFKLGCFFSSFPNGRSYYHRISQFNNGYTFLDTDRQFNNCLKLKKQITVGTFFYICQTNGITISRGQMVAWKNEYEMI